jgi:hypothetical protein
LPAVVYLPVGDSRRDVGIVNPCHSKL